MSKKTALILLACWQTTLAACHLSSSQAVYDFFARNRHVGQVTQTVKVDATHYSIANITEIGFFFLSDHIAEKVTGRIGSQGFQPDEYSLDEAAKKTKQRWKFRVEQNQVTGYMNHHAVKVKNTHWPLYDTSSYQLALRCDLQSSDFHQATYRVISNGRIQQYQAKLISRDSIVHTRLGKIKADQVRVMIMPTAHMALLWFAPKWNYLLVQSSMLLGKNGSVFTSIKQRST